MRLETSLSSILPPKASRTTLTKPPARPSGTPQLTTSRVRSHRVHSSRMVCPTCDTSATSSGTRTRASRWPILGTAKTWTRTRTRWAGSLPRSRTSMTFSTPSSRPSLFASPPHPRACASPSCPLGSVASYWSCSRKTSPWPAVHPLPPRPSTPTTLARPLALGLTTRAMALVRLVRTARTRPAGTRRPSSGPIRCTQRLWTPTPGTRCRR